MNPIDKTDKSQRQTIAFELELRHPPKKVWRALTDPNLLSKWLLPAVDLELREDADFVLMAPPQPGWDGVVSCRFVEIEEHRRRSPPPGSPMRRSFRFSCFSLPGSTSSHYRMSRAGVRGAVPPEARVGWGTSEVRSAIRMGSPLSMLFRAAIPMRSSQKKNKA